MLSRVAESLFWIGRYLERAENVNRLLLVTTEIAVEIEGLDEKLAQAQWDELLAAVGSEPGTTLEFSPATGLALPYVRWLLLDDENPISVRRSLALARENARSAREALTREVFLDLNECHRELDRLSRNIPTDPVQALDEVGRTHRAIRTILGAIEHTLSRDEGWTFMKLGEALERSECTLWILGTRLPRLEELDSRDLPLLNALWRGLLRSTASLENYRAIHGAGMDPESLIRFLLFEPTAPRSIRCGAMRMARYLDRLPPGGVADEARRIVGRLEAQLHYAPEEILADPGPVAFCAEAREQIHKAQAAIDRGYFKG